jgi:ABC-2 type transport system ATP-binding protein
VTAPSENPISVRALSKTYRLGFFRNRRVQALQGLDLTVAPGQVYGILGPNGAGKSTTIKIVMNLVQPSSGEARIFGAPPSDPRARREIGFLPENPAPYEYLTGREFVRLAGQLCGLSGKELDERVEYVLGRVQMAQAAQLQIRRYSKGMVQRIGLAQAIVHRPKLLVLDEPTSGLDPVGRRQMRDLILEERSRGTTILFCTHIISDVEALCDRVAVIVGGKLAREGSVQELVSSQTPWVEFITKNVTLETLTGFGIPFEEAKPVGDRLLVRASEPDGQALAVKIIGSGGQLAQLNPVRYSLEDLFMQAMEDAKRPGVGGDIS